MWRTLRQTECHQHLREDLASECEMRATFTTKLRPINQHGMSMDNLRASMGNERMMHCALLRHLRGIHVLSVRVKRCTFSIRPILPRNLMMNAKLFDVVMLEKNMNSLQIINSNSSWSQGELKSVRWAGGSLWWSRCNAFWLQNGLTSIGMQCGDAAHWKSCAISLALGVDDGFSL